MQSLVYEVVQGSNRIKRNPISRKQINHPKGCGRVTPSIAVPALWLDELFGDIPVAQRKYKLSFIRCVDKCRIVISADTPAPPKEQIQTVEPVQPSAPAQEQSLPTLPNAPEPTPQPATPEQTQQVQTG